jgi:uncharacterized protein
VTKHLNTKFKTLKKNILKMQKVTIGFSGGVDSTFLLKIAKDTIENKVRAVTINSPLLSDKELKDAKKLSNKIGVKHIVINIDLTETDELRKNSFERCYYCKKIVFSKIKNVAKEQGFHCVLDSSNADDLDDYRPGMKALIELGVISPLIEVGLTKQEIRYLSKKMGLPTWNKPSFACLASRFPYGIEITKPRLDQVQRAESLLYEQNIRQYRVRYHNEIARIEVDKKDFKKILANSQKLNQQFRKLGFKYVTLDISGYKTGSLNEDIKNEKTSRRF